MPENDQMQPQQDYVPENESEPTQSEEQQPAHNPESLDNILLMIGVLEEKDHALLAKLVTSHPQFRDQILAEAAQQLGNQIVAKAIEILDGTAQPEAEVAPDAAPTPPEAPSTTGPDQGLLFSLRVLDETSTAELAQILRNHPEMFDAIVAEAVQYCGEQTVQAAVALVRNAAPPEQEPTPPEQVQAESESGEASSESSDTSTEEAPVQEEAGWVVRARAWNTNHLELSHEFNQLTSGACLGANGQLDPVLISNWQANNGVSPDGRVGHNTIAAARALNPAPPAQAQDVPDPEPEPPPAIA